MLCKSDEHKIELEYGALGRGLQISLMSGTLRYYQNIVYNSKSLSWMGCVENGEYELFLKTVNSVQITLILKVNGRVIRNYFNPRLLEELKYTFSTPLKQISVFSYPNIEMNVNQYVSISPIHTEGVLCEEYSCSSDLSKYSLTFNKFNGNIEGILKQSLNIIVKVNCKVKGEIIGLTSVTLSIRECPSNTMPFSVIINSGMVNSDQLIVKLENKNGLEIFHQSGLFPLRRIYYSYCYSSDGYKLILDSKNNEWPSESTVKTVIGGITKTYNSIQELVDTTLLKDIEKWEYSSSFVEHWYQTETEWRTYQIGEFPNRSDMSRTFYFKRDFYFTVDWDVMYYVLNIRHNGGVVIYVNKVIVHRYNIQNEWGSKTLPLNNNEYEGKIRLLTYNLRNGINKIAVELHSGVGGAEVFSLKISTEKDASQCEKVSFPSMILYYDQIGYNENGFDERYMYINDENLYKKYTILTKSNKLGFWFKPNSSYPVNRLDYYVPNDCSDRDWKEVKIYSLFYERLSTGLDNPPDPRYYSTLRKFELDTPSYEDFDRKNPYFMYSSDFSSSDSMQAMYLEIKSKTEGGFKTETSVAELTMFACKPAYCLPTEKVPLFGYEGITEDIKCLYSQEEITYLCSRSGEWEAIVDENICRKSSNNFYRYKKMLFFFIRFINRNIGRTNNCINRKRAQFQIR